MHSHSGESSVVAPILKPPEITDSLKSDQQISDSALIFLQEFLGHMQRAFLGQIHHQNPEASSLDYPELAARAVQRVLAENYGLISAANRVVSNPPELLEVSTGATSWVEQVRDYLVNPIP